MDCELYISPIGVKGVSKVLKHKFFLFLIFSLFFLMISCFSLSDRKGVDNLWRDESKVQNIEEGKTTQNYIIQLFGPPSQIINLDKGVVFYYLLQEKRGKGMFLLLFNFKNEIVSYDRAIFFFDNKGILTDYGFSVENIGRK